MCLRKTVVSGRRLARGQTLRDPLIFNGRNVFLVFNIYTARPGSRSKHQKGVFTKEKEVLEHNYSEFGQGCNALQIAPHCAVAKDSSLFKL